ncbi:hypothetical protein [Mesorhizobium sp. AA23]|uniref:hypothetical protein n=1 Tax=Mesorhizobium sp. AA23 TaxID=1854058 RepID=UPI0007FE91AC|nr:hypothetical protein [Mesorhizobium sp. AA23]OBQ94097.1 hypothetical protein A9K66_28415 [Mesorhizobium sp. AA23]
MSYQPWKWSVEVEEIANRSYVRIIEDGVISIRGFESEANAKSFAHSERARLGLEIEQVSDVEDSRQTKRTPYKPTLR